MGPSTTGLQTIILDSLDIQVLNNDSLFIGQEIILHSTNGQPVRLTNNDYITITGYVEGRLPFRRGVLGANYEIINRIYRTVPRP